MKMLMRMDYNHFCEIIDNTIGKSRSKIVKDNAFSIGIGFNILTAHLKKIAERAIELNDKPLLDLCESLHIIKYTEDEKESEDAE